MAEQFVRVPFLSEADTAAAYSAYVDNHDTRSRVAPVGANPRVIPELIVKDLDTEVAGDKMVLVMRMADQFRALEAAPSFLSHAERPHKDREGYFARIAAVTAAALVQKNPEAAPVEGGGILDSLTADEDAAFALPELLTGHVAYAKTNNFASIEARIPQAMAALDEAGKTDDGLRLQARNVEDFGLNNLPHARAAVALMDEIRAMPGEARLDALTAIHAGVDMRHREFLAPFAVRQCHDLALAGHSRELRGAFIRRLNRFDTVAAPAQAAIAAQSAAYFGARLSKLQAELAKALPPSEVPAFGTDLMPVPEEKEEE